LVNWEADAEYYKNEAASEASNLKNKASNYWNGTPPASSLVNWESDAEYYKN